MKTSMVLATLAVALAFTACSDDKAAEKKQMDVIIAQHDSVMAKTSMVMKYKADLDSLFKTSKDSLQQKTIAGLRVQLDLGESAMETWMHKFNPDFTGKTHQQVTTYLDDQQKQINRIDSIITHAIDQSKKYIETK